MNGSSVHIQFNLSMHPCLVPYSHTYDLEVPKSIALPCLCQAASWPYTGSIKLAPEKDHSGSHRVEEGRLRSVRGEVGVNPTALE